MTQFPNVFTPTVIVSILPELSVSRPYWPSLPKLAARRTGQGRESAEQSEGTLDASEHRHIVKKLPDPLTKNSSILLTNTVSPNTKWSVNPFCQLPEPVIAKLYYKVDVRRHQAVRHEPGIMGIEGLAQELQILFPGAFNIQIKSPIVESRNDMKQPAGNMKSRKSRHGICLDKD